VILKLFVYSFTVGAIIFVLSFVLMYGDIIIILHVYMNQSL